MGWNYFTLQISLPLLQCYPLHLPFAPFFPHSFLLMGRLCCPLSHHSQWCLTPANINNETLTITTIKTTTNSLLLVSLHYCLPLHLLFHERYSPRQHCHLFLNPPLPFWGFLLFRPLKHLWIHHVNHFPQCLHCVLDVRVLEDTNNNRCMKKIYVILHLLHPHCHYHLLNPCAFSLLALQAGLLAPLLWLQIASVFVLLPLGPNPKQVTTLIETKQYKTKEKVVTFVIASLSSRVRSIVDTRGDFVFFPLPGFSFWRNTNIWNFVDFPTKTYSTLRDTRTKSMPIPQNAQRLRTYVCAWTIGSIAQRKNRFTLHNAYHEYISR